MTQNHQASFPDGAGSSPANVVPLGARTDGGRLDRGPLLLLVGWDGATPELLERFVAAGKLPTVERLIKGGSFRRLKSTIPPVTACAWSSFLSGKNPGKHGLFDFVTPRKGSYRFDYTNGGYRKGRGSDILALLNRAGLGVGCVNVPMTYPPPRVDGFLISGLDAPNEASGIAAPADAFEQAQARVGPYRIDNRHLGSMKSDADRRRAVDEFKRIESRRTDVTLAMIESSPRGIDVLVIVYNATDQVQHHFWHLMDADHPAYPGIDSPEVTAFQNAIEEIYVHCDKELARLWEAFPQADFMLMSDHGAGPTSGPRVRLNNALADAGLLRWAKPGGGIGTGLISGVDRFLRRTLTATQKARFARFLPGGRSKIEAMGLPAIDWRQTEAFAFEGFTLSPCVWINRKDLFPEGTVAAGEEYERVCRRVIEALTNLKDPRTGRAVIPQVYRAREIYHGDYVAGAPDLILDWWEGRTFTITRSHPRFVNDQTVFYPPPRAVPGQDITGIHRRDGVLVASGPHFCALDQESLPPADLVDIAPTALALLGLPIPSDMDGRVPPDLVAGRIQAVRRDASVPGGPAGEDADESDATAYSDREREMIEERLSGLGYID